MERSELKIVSGGQTGVDRGALKAAMDFGLDWGGWAPKGWKAEDGSIPQVYRARMREHASANYLGRTRRNVVDSDATMIVAPTAKLSGGTFKTKVFCQESAKPFLVVTLADGGSSDKAVEWLTRQISTKQGSPFVLNVAGLRESKCSGIQKKTRDFLVGVLESMAGRGSHDGK